MLENKFPVTRFAPSPTGSLHIGSARTALFNWLFSRHHGGKFYLRIEDTDSARDSKDAVNNIISGMNWLSLKWDEDIIYQSKRKQRHIEVANQLVTANLAYFCYCTAEELEAMRKRSISEGKTIMYDGTWRNKKSSEAPKGINPSIRFKSPLKKETIINDKILGKISVKNELMDDMILIRSDGNPTYILSNIVDDHDLGVTHVIRGSDHTANALRQSAIYDSLDWERPEFAHIPLIYSPDGKKLSKRDGGAELNSYIDQGYLPEAINNYLLRLGWSHGDSEIISRDQAIKWFDLDHVGKSPAKFDIKKLNNLNQHYMNKLSNELILKNIQSDYQKINITIDNEKKERINATLDEIRKRSKNFNQLNSNLQFSVDFDNIKKNKKSDTFTSAEKNIAKEILNIFESINDWNLEALNQKIRQFSINSGVEFKIIAKTIREIMTRNTTSLGVSEILYILGKKACISRIKLHLNS